jgi:hypothetical protein
LKGEPTPAEAEQWVKWAEGLVSAASEAGACAAFKKWLHGVLASGASRNPRLQPGFRDRL